MTAPLGPRAGRAVARIDPADWSLHPVVADRLLRPIDVRFDLTGEALYVLDFGYFELRPEGGFVAEAGSGKLWRLRLAADSF